MTRLLQRIRGWSGSRMGRTLVAFNLLVVFVPAVGVLYLDVYEARLLDAQERAMIQQARLVAAAAAELPDPSAVERVLARLERHTESRIRVYDSSGRVIADSARGHEDAGDESYSRQASGTRQRVLYRIGAWIVDAGDTLRSAVRSWGTRGTPARERPMGPLPPELQAALGGHYGADARPTPGQRSLTLYSAMPIRRDGAVTGAVVVSQSTFRILHALYDVRLRIFEIVVASLIFAAALSIATGVWLVRPLVRLRRLAVALAERRGPVSPAFPGSDRRDEIGDLSRALQELTQRLDEHIRLLESFAGDVAHEFKNPLASIRTAAEMMHQAADASERERFLLLLNRDVDRLERLITGVRDLARIDGQLENESQQVIDLNALVVEVVEGVRLTRPHDVEIALHRSEQGPALVKGSRERLQQVIENIISNAASFTARGTTVEVTVSATASECAVTVEDRGPGIPEAHLGKVFDRFFTYRPGIDRRQHIGLGLAIARTIVEGHGGSIAASNRDGGGARLEVRLRRIAAVQSV